MARWEPDAQGRLLRAALDLFAENGYEATTTTQIAERAGLTKTTLFRLFSDKPDIVFQAQDQFVAMVRRGVDEAPTGASATEMMISGIRLLSTAHTADNREIGRVLDPILKLSPELNERAIFKRFSITSALEHALVDHGVDSPEAGILADLGVRAYYAGYDAWVASDDPASLTDFAQAHIEKLKEALARLAR